KEVNYAYKLQGFDKDWNMAGRQTSASYTNVPDGHYVFKIKATNDEGQWSEASMNIAIQIKPPFWRTWWFIILCVCLVSGGIYLIYLNRIHQMRRIYSLK